MALIPKIFILLIVGITTFCIRCDSKEIDMSDAIFNDPGIIDTIYHSASEKKSEILYKELEAAFEQSSEKSIKQFFAKWNESSTPNTIAFIEQNETIKTVFEIYKDLYTIPNLSTIFGIYKDSLIDSQYIIIQNRIRFKKAGDNTQYPHNFNEPIYSDNGWIYINNFRPSLNISDTQILYLTDDYDHALSEFLNPSGFYDGYKRAAFIDPYVSISHIDGRPRFSAGAIIKIYSIILGTETETAKIEFNCGGGMMGGEAVIHKKAGKWTITKSEITRMK